MKRASAFVLVFLVGLAALWIVIKREGSLAKLSREGVQIGMHSKRKKRSGDRTMTSKAGPRKDGPDSRLAALDDRSLKSVLSPDQIKRYFDVAGRSDRTVSMVFWLTGDGEYLQELRNYPDSKIALGTLAIRERDPVQAEKDAIRLRELDPMDPYGHYLCGFWQAQRKEIVPAMESLRETLALPGNITTDSAALYQEATEALKIMGLDPVESGIHLSQNPAVLQLPGTNFSKIMYRIMEISDEISESDRVAYAGDLLKLNERMADEGCGNSIASFMKYKKELDLLALLPDDYAYGENSSVVARREEVRRLMKEEGNLERRSLEVLQASRPETVERFYGLVSAEGAVAARTWLLDQGDGSGQE